MPEIELSSQNPEVGTDSVAGTADPPGNNSSDTVTGGLKTQERRQSSYAKLEKLYGPEMAHNPINVWKNH